MGRYRLKVRRINASSMGTPSYAGRSCSGMTQVVKDETFGDRADE